MELLNKEIIIPRKKSTSIKSAIFMILLSALFIFVPCIYFFEISWITSKPPLIAVICSLVFLPVFIFCAIIFIKQIFNDEPILVINELGIKEEMSAIHAGLIKWEDIELVSVSPYLDNTYWIHIYLKNPSEYIKNARTLEKLEKQAKHHNAGHICFTSFYFKKEIYEVSALIEYYIEHNNPRI